MWRKLWPIVVTLWQNGYERVYQREHEHHVPFKDLELDKQSARKILVAWDADGNAHHFKMGILFLWFMIGGIMLLHAAGIDLPENSHSHPQTEKQSEVEAPPDDMKSLYLPGFVMLGGATLMFYSTLKAQEYHSRRYLSQVLGKCGDHPLLQSKLNKYRYFFLRHDGFVFSDHRPWYTFCNSTRLPTTYRWQDRVRKNPIFAIVEYVAVTSYLRIAWPYIFNPMQLSFLEYDKAAKALEFKKGEKVLLVGAGSVPHHVRWKRRLGSTGSITALDIEPLVLKDSYRWEWLIESVRGLFEKRRWISTHVEGCAAELPFEDGLFDYVVAIRCYYVSVEESLRVLKSGGKVLIWSCGDVTGLPEDDRVKRYDWGWVVTNTTPSEAENEDKQDAIHEVVAVA